MTDVHDEREARPPSTMFDLAKPVNRRVELHRTPGLVVDAVRIVWRASARHFLATLGLQLVSGVGVAAQLFIARRMLQDLVDVSHGASVTPLYGVFGVFVLVGTALGVVNAVTLREQALLGELVGRHAFDQIIRVSSRADYRLFETSAFYDELQRARTSGQFRTIDVVNSLSALVSAVLTSVGIAVVLFVLEPLLLVFVVAAAVPLLLAAVYNSRQAYVFEYAMTPESRERAYVVELMTERGPAKELRLFNLGSFLHQRFAELNDRRLREFRLFLRRRLVISLFGNIAGAAGTAIALGALVLLLDRGRIGVASAITAGVAMQQLGGRLTALTANLGRLIESGMFIDDYNAFVSRDRDGPDGSGPGTARGSTAQRFEGMRVENVTFTYPARAEPALADVSLEIAPGEVVALVGANGSGKTTLVKLICQLYAPNSGRIVWNGVDARALPVDELRSDITVLFQDFIQYHFSVLDNIVLGRVERAARAEEAVDAAVRAGAHDFVSRLPDAYDTRLGLQFYAGHELSVGQWQRLALARAFFRGGSFLILDEPTAALDARAERDLFDHIRGLSEGKSVLLISHRFSSVRTADRIYVLEAGRVAESGTHVELMRRRGLYAELFELQAAAYLGGRSLERDSIDNA